MRMQFRFIFLQLLVSVVYACISSFSYASDYEKQYDIIGIGITQIDITSFVTDDELKRTFKIPYNINKGTLTIIDKVVLDSIISQLKNASITPSGETASILYNFASLGGNAAFDSKFTNDEYGKIFKQNLQRHSIDMLLFDTIDDSLDISVNVNLVTPDGERTRILYQGSSAKITQQDIEYNLIKNTKYLLMEGSLWEEDSKMVKRALNVAKKLNIKTVLTLSDVLFVKSFARIFLENIQDIDILFGNCAEIKALYKTDSLNVAIENLKKIPILAVITLGKDGAMIIDHGKIVDIPISSSDCKIIDTSGAGSAFAAGFLYGIINGKSVQQSGYIAEKVAEKI